MTWKIILQAFSDDLEELVKNNLTGCLPAGLMESQDPSTCRFRQAEESDEGETLIKYTKEGEELERDLVVKSTRCSFRESSSQHLVGWLTTAWKSPSRGSDALLWPP